MVIDSGTPGDTRAMVQAVAARRPAVDPVFEAIGDLVGRALPALPCTMNVGIFSSPFWSTT